MRPEQKPAESIATVGQRDARRIEHLLQVINTQNTDAITKLANKIIPNECDADEAAEHISRYYALKKYFANMEDPVGLFVYYVERLDSIQDQVQTENRKLVYFLSQLEYLFKELISDKLAQRFAEKLSQYLSEKHRVDISDASEVVLTLPHARVARVLATNLHEVKLSAATTLTIPSHREIQLSEAARNAYALVVAQLDFIAARIDEIKPSDERKTLKFFQAQVEKDLPALRGVSAADTPLGLTLLDARENLAEKIKQLLQSVESIRSPLGITALGAENYLQQLLAETEVARKAFRAASQVSKLTVVREGVENTIDLRAGEPSLPSQISILLDAVATQSNPDAWIAAVKVLRDELKQNRKHNEAEFDRELNMERRFPFSASPSRKIKLGMPDQRLAEFLPRKISSSPALADIAEEPEEQQQPELSVEAVPAAALEGLLTGADGLLSDQPEVISAVQLQLPAAVLGPLFPRSRTVHVFRGQIPVTIVGHDDAELSDEALRAYNALYPALSRVADEVERAAYNDGYLPVKSKDAPHTEAAESKDGSLDESDAEDQEADAVPQHPRKFTLAAARKNLKELNDRIVAAQDRFSKAKPRNVRLKTLVKKLFSRADLGSLATNFNQATAESVLITTDFDRGSDSRREVPLSVEVDQQINLALGFYQAEQPSLGDFCHTVEVLGANLTERMVRAEDAKDTQEAAVWQRILAEPRQFLFRDGRKISFQLGSMKRRAAVFGLQDHLAEFRAILAQDVQDVIKASESGDSSQPFVTALSRCLDDRFVDSSADQQHQQIVKRFFDQATVDSYKMRFTARSDAERAMIVAAICRELVHAVFNKRLDNGRLWVDESIFTSLPPSSDSDLDLQRKQMVDGIIGLVEHIVCSLVHETAPEYFREGCTQVRSVAASISSDLLRAVPPNPLLPVLNRYDESNDSKTKGAQLGGGRAADTSENLEEILTGHFSPKVLAHYRQQFARAISVEQQLVLVAAIWRDLLKLYFEKRRNIPLTAADVHSFNGYCSTLLSNFIVLRDAGSIVLRAGSQHLNLSRPCAIVGRLMRRVTDASKGVVDSREGDVSAKTAYEAAMKVLDKNGAELVKAYGDPTEVEEGAFSYYENQDFFAFCVEQLMQFDKNLDLSSSSFFEKLASVQSAVLELVLSKNAKDYTSQQRDALYAMLTRRFFVQYAGADSKVVYSLSDIPGDYKDLPRDLVEAAAIGATQAIQAKWRVVDLHQDTAVADYFEAIRAYLIDDLDLPECIAYGILSGKLDYEKYRTAVGGYYHEIRSWYDKARSKGVESAINVIQNIKRYERCEISYDQLVFYIKLTSNKANLAATRYSRLSRRLNPVLLTGKKPLVRPAAVVLPKPAAPSPEPADHAVVPVAESALVNVAIDGVGNCLFESVMVALVAHALTASEKSAVAREVLLTINEEFTRDRLAEKVKQPGWRKELGLALRERVANVIRSADHNPAVLDAFKQALRDDFAAYQRAPSVYVDAIPSAYPFHKIAEFVAFFAKAHEQQRDVVELLEQEGELLLLNAYFVHINKPGVYAHEIVGVALNVFLRDAVYVRHQGTDIFERSLAAWITVDSLNRDNPGRPNHFEAVLPATLVREFNGLEALQESLEELESPVVVRPPSPASSVASSPPSPRSEEELHDECPQEGKAHGSATPHVGVFGAAAVEEDEAVVPVPVAGH